MQGTDAQLYSNMRRKQDAEKRNAEARAFVDFVLRHTYPERATAHGAEAVYSIIKNHPFAQAYGPTKADADG